jgi:lipopolysaccharide/colanic/teichoic acid biosynthesis glycosyltransferase
MISLFVLLDVGSPVVFWQQRVGRGGSSFFLYKFRTLHPPFDRETRPVSEVQRLSWIGRLLRNGRLDELPQLLNVLVGEMSLIGPRPLLPDDQPTNSKLRLLARPGVDASLLFTGERRSESALKEALHEQKNGHSWKKLPFTRKAVREELGPAFRERFGLRAKSIKVRTQPDPHPDQLDRNKDL